ncbi:MAG: hypothetical protein KDA47_06520, partial [Planctomycetales bacterium]|nr:hypothetical protein [Planctomycetales bacterium]
VPPVGTSDTGGHSALLSLARESLFSDPCGTLRIIPLVDQAATRLLPEYSRRRFTSSLGG